MFRAIAAGGAASAVLCRQQDCTLELIDVGIDGDVSDVQSGCPHISVVHAKVKPGSASMLMGPALSREDMTAALIQGQEAVLRAVGGLENPSQHVLCIGEVGIGNTTAAAAILAALGDLLPEEVCGRGTGLDDVGLEIKQNAVREALKINQKIIYGIASSLMSVTEAQNDGNQLKSAPGILQAVGGLEIAAMVGAYLQAGELGVPTIVDGYVSGAAALLALHSHNNTSNEGGAANKEGSSGEKALRNALFWSHRSAELASLTKASGKLLKVAGVEYDAPLQMNMRLGEGTGAVLALPLLRCAAAVAKDMFSLDQALALGPPSS